MTASTPSPRSTPCSTPATPSPPCASCAASPGPTRRSCVLTWGRAEQCETRVILAAIGGLLPPRRRVPVARSRSAIQGGWRHSSSRGRAHARACGRRGPVLRLPRPGDGGAGAAQHPGRPGVRSTTPVRRRPRAALAEAYGPHRSAGRPVPAAEHVPVRRQPRLRTADRGPHVRWHAVDRDGDGGRLEPFRPAPTPGCPPAGGCWPPSSSGSSWPRRRRRSRRGSSRSSSAGAAAASCSSGWRG